MEEIGLCLRKGLMVSIRTCYRSAHKHPFVMGFVLFSFLLYRFLPFLFGFLVSSSPVLVCTFALLGTLLSYGGGQHPNNNIIPHLELEQEQEQEEQEEVDDDGDEKKTRKETHHDQISSLKAEAGVAETDHLVETHVDKEVKEKDWAFTATSLIENEPEEVGIHSHNHYQLIKEEGSNDHEFYEKREFHEVEPLIERAASVANSDDVCEQDEVRSSYVGGKEIEEEPLIRMDEEEETTGEFLLPPSNTHLEDPFGFAKKIEEDHDDESFESDSDGAESSSPDASMTDIMPMLDELHPLLDIEASQPASHISSPEDDDDDAASASERSNDDNVDSGEEEEEVEHHEEEDDDDEEEEEGHQESHEDGAKNVVTWTEDDEKNLMDLGNSELERNRRLESLIARRWARKNFRIMEAAEKNMIDLDFNGPPFHIAPISTTRRNPFDIHYDSNMGMGLPPIPGSAPSVLLPRRNPFDLPYDPHEERPDLTGGSFNDEFVTAAHDKDRYFSRHESFNLASYYFGEHKLQEKQDKFRPYFVTEQMASEGVGYSRFQRQLSERSDSKVSSASETESHSSIANNHDEHMTSSEGVGYSRFHRQLSEMSDSKVSSASETESHSSVANYHDEHNNSVEEQVSQEGEPISTHVDHTADHVILESVFSKEVNLDDIEQEDKEDVDLSKVEDDKSEDEENANETHSSFLSSEFVTSRMEPNTSNVHVNPEMGEIKQHTRSSSSSSSDVHEKIFDVNIDEELANLEPARGDISEFSNSMQPTVVGSNLNGRVGEAADDSRTEEPVYDLSPSASERAIFGMANYEEALSEASDLHVEVPEVSSTPIAVEGTISLTHGESSLPLGSPRKDMTSAYERSWAPSPELCAIDENESTSTEITNKHDAVEVGTSAASVVEQDLFDFSSSSSESEAEKEGSLCEKASLQFEQEQVLPLSSDAELSAGVHQSDEDEKVDALASSSDGVSPKTSSASEQQPPLMEKMLVHPSADVNCEESQEPFVAPEIATEEVTVGGTANEQKGDDLPNLSPLLSVPASLPLEVPENQLNQMVSEDKFHDEIPYQYHNTCQVLGDLDFYQGAIGQHVTEEEFVEETEGIGEIDEALLTELDAVGDFSFEELEASPNQRENQLGVEMHGSLTGLRILEAKSSEDFEDDSDKFHKVIEEPYEPLESGCMSAHVEHGDRYIEVNRSTSELQVPDASSSEGIDSTVKQLHDELLLQETEDGNADFALPNQEPNLIDTDLEMPVLEAKSLEDIDSAFRQLHERENQKSVVPEPVHDETNLEETIGESAESCKQLHDEPLSKEDVNSEFALPTEEPNLTEMDLEPPVPDAKSFEDIDSVFKQLDEGDLENSFVHEPVHDESIMAETNVGSAESFKQVHAEPLLNVLEEPNLVETNLELPVLEARSLEDIDLIYKQINEGEAEQSVLKPAQNESILEETEVGSFPDFREVERPTIHGQIKNETILEETIVASAEQTGDPGSSDVNLELSDHEARTFEEIESAFNVGDDDEKRTHESVENKPQVVDPQDSTQRLSDLQVLEEKSEGSLPEKQLSEDMMEKQLKPYESEEGQVEVSAKALESTVEITSRVEESLSQETGTDIGESSSSKAGSKKKKTGSSKSSSSSSSSSSDSD